MADYKDMLKETLNNLGEKAKDITENAAEMAREYAGSATDFAKDFKENAQEKAREYADAANERAKNFTDGDPVKDFTDRAKKIRANTKLAFEANGVNEDLKKVYMEIGKLYFETAEAEEGSYFEPLFRKARQLNDQLDELNRKMAEEPSEPEPETVIAEEAEATAAGDAE